MPVVNREVVLPVPRERAWELITEPSELEGWLGDDVEFEAEEDAPLRVDDREGVVEEVVEHERIVFRWGDSRVEWALEDAISGTRFVVTEHRFAADTITWGPKLMALSSAAHAVPGVDEVFFALSDPTRREVLRSVARQPDLTASRLAGELPITRQAVAKHLAALQRAGLVEPHREGRETRYTLTPAPLDGRDDAGWPTSARPGTGGSNVWWSERAGKVEAGMAPAALVTGAASGIGKATAERLRADGYDVLGFDLEDGDLTTREGNERAVAMALERFGRLDVVVANAGVQHVAPVREFPEDRWDQIIAILLTSPFLLGQVRVGRARGQRSRPLHRRRLRARARRLAVQGGVRRRPSTACSGW